MGGGGSADFIFMGARIFLKLIEFFVEFTELGEELSEFSVSRVHTRGVMQPHAS